MYYITPCSRLFCLCYLYRTIRSPNSGCWQYYQRYRQRRCQTYSQQSKTKYKEISNIMFTDVWGPAWTTGIKGEHYYISFMDSATQCTQIHFMKKRMFLDISKITKPLSRLKLAKTSKLYDLMVEENILIMRWLITSDLVEYDIKSRLQ